MKMSQNGINLLRKISLFVKGKRIETLVLSQFYQL